MCTICDMSRGRVDQGSQAIWDAERNDWANCTYLVASLPVMMTRDWEKRSDKSSSHNTNHNTTNSICYVSFYACSNHSKPFTAKLDVRKASITSFTRDRKPQMFTPKNIPVAPQPPYSLNLNPCDFFLFTKLKNHLKGHHFKTLENIQTSVTDQPKAIPISEFYQCYEEWKKRLQLCVASESSYCEGDNDEL
ncbi:putative transposase [Trichonephila clavipes]|nr:putative transposase [Trichonephila clavipes]